MSEIKLVKFIFKSGKKKVWLDWVEELKKRRKEVVETLKNEGVTTEACFLSSEGNEVFYLMEAEDFEKVKIAAERSTHLIDKEHKEKRLESMERIDDFDLLFYFSNKG